FRVTSWRSRHATRTATTKSHERHPPNNTKCPARLRAGASSLPDLEAFQDHSFCLMLTAHLFSTYAHCSLLTLAAPSLIVGFLPSLLISSLPMLTAHSSLLPHPPLWSGFCLHCSSLLYPCSLLTAHLRS